VWFLTVGRRHSPSEPSSLKVHKRCIAWTIFFMFSKTSITNNVFEHYNLHLDDRLRQRLVATVTFRRLRTAVEQMPIKSSNNPNTSCIKRMLYFSSSKELRAYCGSNDETKQWEINFNSRRLTIYNVIHGDVRKISRFIENWIYFMKNISHHVYRST